MTLSILIADEQPLFRAGLESVLCKSIDVAIVGRCNTAHETVTVALELAPKIVVIGLALDCGGLRAAGEIKKHLPRTRIIFITTSERHEDVSAALKLGAAAYMLKTVAAHDLIAAIRMIVSGETYITPSLAARLYVDSQVGNTQASDPFTQGREHLTEREREILNLVRQGCTNKEIARKLGRAEKTVKHHVGRVLQKLSARNRTEAALLWHDTPATDANKATHSTEDDAWATSLAREIGSSDAKNPRRPAKLSMAIPSIYE